MAIMCRNWLPSPLTYNISRGGGRKATELAGDRAKRLKPSQKRHSAAMSMS
jgi:hypothetical protein